jgi:hypothetical protein
MKANKAYANGAIEGYNVGVYSNPYNPTNEAEQHQAYKEGYDYGVFLYTQDESGQQEEK